jgi:type II secretory pathway pseudopilin PulG
MQKSMVIVLSGIVALLLTFAVSSASAQSSYAEDRAMIEDLQARYLFALDFRDAEAYASTFSNDGVLDFGAGEIRGRDAIRNFIVESRKNAEAQAAKDTSGLRPAAGRHNITNIVIKINGDKAIGRAYWFHMGNNNPKRTATLNSFGHYEDEMVKVDGRWLFSKRKIYNEQVDRWAAKGNNPAW